MTKTTTRDPERTVLRLTRLLDRYVKLRSSLFHGLPRSASQPWRAMRARRALLVKLTEVVRAELTRTSETLLPPDRLTPEALEEGGFDMLERTEAISDPIGRGEDALREMMRTSLSVPAAAVHLGMSQRKIRQSLARRAPDLYGIKTRKGWVLPRFQFRDSGGLVPNIEKVIPRLPANLHPLTVNNWFTLPNPDLPDCLETRLDLSPVEWLALGRSPERVGDVASAIEG